MIGCLFVSVLRGLGSLGVSIILLSLSYEIVGILFRRIHNKTILKRLSGKWAIITGCTDGIGLSMAKELANQGINLILISRSLEKLTSLQEELSKKVQTEIIPIDFEEEIDFTSVLSQIKKYNPSVLVNNVGVNGTRPTLFTELMLKDIDRIVKVNISNTLKITKEYISWETSPSEKKYVLTVGSMLGSIPSPYQQVYSGTKAFLQMWSESIAAEIEGYHFELLMTGLVCSKLSGAKRPNLFTPTSDKYGKCCVHSFGSSSVTYPYFPHFILSIVCMLTPRIIIGLVVGSVGQKVRKRHGIGTRKTE